MDLWECRAALYDILMTGVAGLSMFALGVAAAFGWQEYKKDKN